MNLVDKINQATAIIENAVMNYGNKLAVFCSWGKDSMVVLDIARKVNPDIQVYTIMTPMKPKETKEYANKMIEEWGLDVVVFESTIPVQDGLWKTNPDLCCKVYKVQPTLDALEDLDTWITGLRKDEGYTRHNYETEEYDGKTNTMKINPILDFTELDIWKYLAINNIPVHPWYAKGYRSIGCEPCTHLVDDNKPERAGRWKGTSKCGGECGIHTFHKNKESGSKKSERVI